MEISKTEILGFLLLFSVFFMLIFSFLPEDYFGKKSQHPYLPPSPSNPLGTNDIGEDVLKNLLIGSRVSLTIGIMSALVATGIGTLIGVISGFFGGKIDEFCRSLTDIFLVIPGLPMMVVLAAYLGPSYFNVIIVIGLLWWPATARIVRARAVQIANSVFVEGLIGIGASRGYIVIKHILPNVYGVALARFVLTVPSAIILEAGLSFIGLGDPRNPSWGTALHFAMTRGALLHGAWWTFIPPGLCIAVTALLFLLIGFGIEKRYREGVKSMERSL